MKLRIKDAAIIGGSTEDVTLGDKRLGVFRVQCGSRTRGEAVRWYFLRSMTGLCITSSLLLAGSLDGVISW